MSSSGGPATPTSSASDLTIETPADDGFSEEQAQSSQGRFSVFESDSLKSVEDVFDDKIPSFVAAMEERVKEELKAGLKDELKVELKEELEKEIKDEVMAELRLELTAEEKEEIRKEIKEDLKAELREELRVEHGNGNTSNMRPTTPRSTG